jgi:serine/threonine-protein kinase
VKTCPVCAAAYPDEARFCPTDGQALRAASPGGDLVGQVLADRYHIVRRLGEGGMGRVYLAEHVKMGRKSAIKVMNPAMAHDPDAVARFNREAANASRITHPHVCAIYDFGETPEGLLYLAMEYVEGEPLTCVLEREGALPVARAVGIFLQVADALQAAHELGIVHRDLKPDNIMVTRGRAGADAVKVVDFGIAKAVGTDDRQQVTRTGLVVGTPEFMSPEQLSGDPLDGRSDIYSLALVLFKMLTGTLPFVGDTTQELMVKRLTEQPRTLAAARPDRHFPLGLEEALATALARAPADRYRSAAEFAEAVAAAVADAGTELLAPPRPRRSRAALALGTLAALALAGGAVALVLGGRSQSRATARPEQRLDSASVDRDLGAILELLDARTAAEGRRRAEPYYENAEVPATLRARAAFIVATAFLLERRAADACRWNDRALALAPRNAVYTGFKSDQGCR